MSAENLYKISEEILKTDLFVEEKKFFKEFYKVIFIESPLESFPLTIPHGIESIKLGIGEYNAILSLVVDGKKRLHPSFQNVSVNIDADNIIIYTEEKGEKVSGKIILNYKKEGEFEVMRIVRGVERTEAQNFGETS